MPRIIAVLCLPKAHTSIITYARAVAMLMEKDPAFPSPTPPTDIFLAHIEELAEAQTATLTRAVGKAAARDVKLLVVTTDLEARRMYVQTCANADPPNAAAIIARAGMTVKASSGHGKAEFAAQAGPVSGSVHIYARASRSRSSYDWQHSKDQVHWNSVDSTVRADVIIRGLELMTTHYFRFRRVTKAGVSDWSQVVTFFVV